MSNKTKRNGKQKRMYRKVKHPDTIRIPMPKGIQQQSLELAAKLHGAPALSQYVLLAAMSYTTSFLEERAELIRRKNDGEDNPVPETEATSEGDSVTTTESEADIEG